MSKDRVLALIILGVAIVLLAIALFGCGGGPADYGKYFAKPEEAKL